MSQSGLFLQTIWNRLNKLNKNAIIVVVGPTGSGKSYAAISLGEKLDSNFCIERVVFDNEEFEALITSGVLKPGSIIVWDEAGAGIAAREAMHKKNIRSGKIAQTFRNLNYGLILTLPSLTMLDSQFRDLAHYLLKPLRINRWTKRCIVAVKRIDHNEQTRKTYYTRLDVRKDGKKHTLRSIRVTMPSKKMREQYELKKTEYQKKLYAKVTTKVKRGRSPTNITKMVDKVFAKKDKYMKQWGERQIFDQSLIATDLKVGGMVAYRIKRAAEAKM